MTYYDRIHISGGTDVNMTSESKGCEMSLLVYFK